MEQGRLMESNERAKDGKEGKQDGEIEEVLKVFQESAAADEFFIKKERLNQVHLDFSSFRDSFTS